MKQRDREMRNLGGKKVLVPLRGTYKKVLVPLYSRPKKVIVRLCSILKKVLVPLCSMPKKFLSRCALCQNRSCPIV